MAKRRVKTRTSSTTSGPSNDGATSRSQEEVIVPTPATVNGDGTEVPFEVKNDDKHKSEEGRNEEVAVLVAHKEEEIKNEDKHTSEEGTNEVVGMLVMENGVVAQEVENEEAAINNENIEMAALEEEVEDGGFDEPNSTEEKDDDQEEEEAREYWEEEDEEEEDDAEDEDAEDGEGEWEDEEEEEEEEEQIEKADEVAGQEGKKEEENVEEALVVTKTEEKIVANSGGVAKKLIVQSRLKKVGTKMEDKPTPINKMVASTAEDNHGESSKKKVATTEEDKAKLSSKKKGATIKEDKAKSLSKKPVAATAEDKPEALGKKQGAITAEDKPDASGKKKGAITAEDKPEASGKKQVAATAEYKPEASGKKKGAITAEDKPEASGKKKGSITVEDKPETSSKKKGAITAEDKPEASNKKKTSQRVKSMGLIFMCNSKTKQDCYRYKVLGLPASKKNLVQKVYKGMRLFLFDIDKRLMYGIYKAAGPGGYDIQPKAFGSAFPSQVRFTVLEDCLPLSEAQFKPILKDNYYAKKKFDCQLNSEQVKNLCKLFSASGKVSRFKNPKGVAGIEIHPDAQRARIERPRVDGERLGRGRIKRKRLDKEILDLRPRVDNERFDRGRIKRERLDEESRERRRIRQQILDEERLDRDRITRQRQDEETLDRDRVRRQKLVEESWDPRYHDRPIAYERERYASPLPPPSQAYGSSSRAYDSYFRNAETAMYTRDPVVDHRERVLVPEYRGRLPAVDHREGRILDLDTSHRDGVGTRDPYASYREYNPPRVQAATYPHLASSASQYRLPPVASSASEYHLPGEAPGYEYAPLRPLYRY